MPDVSGLVANSWAAYIMLPIPDGCQIDTGSAGGTHPNGDETTCKRWLGGFWRHIRRYTTNSWCMRSNERNDLRSLELKLKLFWCKQPLM
ncbi:MAG: hypothetical protein IPJ13_01525 [Saprospiraceae bacterium]|nr:hypothetical protein [Saprospiraceae bacterium]